MKRSFLLSSIAGLAFSTLLFYHCSKITGNRPANTPPEIAFANIPPDSTTVTSKPTVYWFGKDIDGYVAEYQYVVATASQIAVLGLTADGFANILRNFGGFNWVASCSLWADSLEVLGELRIQGIVLATERGKGQTNAQIQLFASSDSTVFIPQYIFLRAVDNLGLQSDSTRYRLFSRNNHPPNTRIEGFNTAEVHYSLPETTATWKGIRIDWSGSDSSDYPRVQPEFEYHLELYGPFPRSIDANPGPNFLLADTAWVPWKSVILPKGIDPSLATLKTGWYLFRVTARDDALIEDPTPATAVFLVIRPTCNSNKPILAVDVTYYSPATFGYELDSAKVRMFYQTLFTNAGVSITDSDFIFVRLRESPPESLLSQYKMILLINHDLLNNTPNETTYSQLVKYLSVGGKVWLMGMNNFNVRSGFAQRRDLKSLYALDAKQSYYMGFNFCGVKEVYFAEWTSLGDSGNCPPLSPACKALPKDTAWYRQRNEEFIGADPLPNLFVSNLPTLEVDTLKVKALTTKKSGVSLIFYDKLPGVDYNTITSSSNPAEAFYLFKSYRGNASPLHGKPCALGFEGPRFQATYPDVDLRGKPIFKTAVFTFPLYYMNQTYAEDATRLLLQWFQIGPTDCNFPQ